MGSKKEYQPCAERALEVTSDAFKALAEEDVPEEERFFHHYFTQMRRANRPSKKEDLGDIDDDEFDKYLETLEFGKKNAEDLDFAAGTTGGIKSKAEGIERWDSGRKDSILCRFGKPESIVQFLMK